MLMQTHEARLDALRKELARRGLDGFVVPISDEHMSEYVGAYAQRLAWLTGFGGSAGSAVVLKDRAARWGTLQTSGNHTGPHPHEEGCPVDKVVDLRWMSGGSCVDMKKADPGVGF